MAKTIKFPLKLKNDFPVRTLEELKEHFDLGKMVGYFLDGKLLTWLQARYYETEADLVKDLSKDDADLKAKLCEIFDVELSDFQQTIDVEVAEKRNQRLSILRQYTSDTSILAKVDSVAFNQEELGDLLDEDVHDIYLCNNTFTIPLQVENKKYIGVGKAIVIIRSDEPVDFFTKNIEFFNVNFDDKYARLLIKNAEPKDNVTSLMEKAYLAKSQEDYETALDYYQKAANFGNGEAMDKIAEFYNVGLGVPKDDAIAYMWYKKSAEAGFAEGMNDFAWICHWGQTPSGESENETALYWFKKAGDAGFAEAYNQVGWFYQNGIGVAQNYTEAVIWYEKAANHNVADAFNNLAWLYDHAIGVPYDHNKAMEYYRAGANGGCLFALLNLGTILFQEGNYQESESRFSEAIAQNSGQAYNMLGVIQEVYHHQLQIAKQYYESAGNLGDANGMFNAARIYEKEENFNKAFYWYEKAANNNDAKAIYSLGRFYNNGYGVPRNVSLAEQYYYQAANLGLDLAQAAYQRFQKERAYTDYSNEYMWGGGFEPMGMNYD